MNASSVKEMLRYADPAGGERRVGTGRRETLVAKLLWFDGRISDPLAAGSYREKRFQVPVEGAVHEVVQE